MPELQVSFLLPYYLRVAEDEYTTGNRSEDRLYVIRPELVEGQPPRTQVRARFTHPDTNDQNEIQRLKARDADRLLWRTNHLLRWYRVVTRRADVVELTRAQASPFSFLVTQGPADAAWGTPLAYEGPGLAALELTHRANHQPDSGFDCGSRDPDVGDLFFLDAERALSQGRFREAVLFCWSTIDTVFNRKYAALANVVLAGGVADSRAFFTGKDFALKSKMSAGLHLLVGRSVFREPDNLWDRMVTSYTKRNNIIHQGHTANEDEARQAIDVAQHIVAMMNGIPVPPPTGGGG